MKFKDTILQLVTSKKALALLAGAIVWALAQAGVVASPDAILPLLALIASYVVGQGLADVGKEKKKIEAEMVKDIKANLPEKS